jgi:major membrane immunogen (membrane-anchored lipoprotein)
MSNFTNSHYATYYLNNRGSRWVNLDKNGNKDKITLKTKSGKLITRTAQFHESFGNFATTMITYKGKRMMVFADTKLED